MFYHSNKKQARPNAEPYASISTPQDSGNITGREEKERKSWRMRKGCGMLSPGHGRTAVHMHSEAMVACIPAWHSSTQEEVFTRHLALAEELWAADSRGVFFCVWPHVHVQQAAQTELTELLVGHERGKGRET